MIGVVDVGGGMRGVYGAGVFDYCMEHDISFDYCAGVSAGSANVSAYAADQRGRNYRYYTNYAFRPEYMSLRNFITKGSYLDLDYVYGELSNSDGEDPLDFKMMVRSGKKLVIVTTDAETGEAAYFGIEDMAQDDYAPVKGSSCVPVICKPYPVKGRLMLDGGMSDPIPVQKALDDGCEKVVLILTRPRDMYRDPERDRNLARLLVRKYPKAARKLLHRGELYNRQLDLAKRYEAEGKVHIVSPSDIGKMQTLTKDRAAQERMYGQGYRDASSIRDFLK